VPMGLIYQREGSSEVKQGTCVYLLKRGMMLSVNPDQPFSLESIGMTYTNLILFPKALAKERMPSLFGQTSQIIAADDPALKLFIRLVDDLFNLPPDLSEQQETGIVEAFFALLNAISVPKTTSGRSTHWRVKRAVAKINDWMSEPTLSAASIADEQGISRRRLDQLFVQEIGSTIAMQISERRLTSAAADLCDPSQRDTQIASIAYGAGFRDHAHFSRLFKDKFGLSPKAWRKQMVNQP